MQVDPTVFHMLNEDPGGISFSEIGGLGDQIRELREVIELPLTNPELFTRVGIKPPKVQCHLVARICAWVYCTWSAGAAAVMNLENVLLGWPSLVSCLLKRCVSWTTCSVFGRLHGPGTEGTRRACNPWCSVSLLNVHMA